jgi:two-component system sensor histidine kinase KdpD
MKLSEIEHFSYNSDTYPRKIKLRAVNIAVTVIIMTFAILLSFLFRHIGLLESNIIVAFILGVLLVAKLTDGFFYGILASIIGVLTFNFLFTEPYYSFSVYRPDYPVTFVIMLIAAIITSTLTTKAKQEAKLSLLREKRAKILYQFSVSLLKVTSMDEIAEVGVKDIAELFNRSVIIAALNSSDGLEVPHIYAFNDDERADIIDSFHEIQVLSEIFKTSNPIGASTKVFVDSSAYYLPIKGQSGNLGIVGVSCTDNKLLSDEQKTLLELVTTQIALAMEREKLSEKQQKSIMEVESERLRGNLLRAMSHDLRTPLTGILGATATILDHGGVLDETVKKSLLQGVYEDASWLIYSVENILSITRMDEGKIEIKKNMEAVEEVVAEAVSRIKKLTANHTLKINIPDDLIMLPMDGILIEQVLINLIDNAIKYTSYGTTIEMKIRMDGEQVAFEVSDNGLGIPEENLNLIFNRFYTTTAINNAGRHGTGLGLAICKSIITAHNGEITAFNNPSGGATFRFILPVKE